MELVGDIAAASGEQSEGIDQINKAVPEPSRSYPPPLAQGGRGEGGICYHLPSPGWISDQEVTRVMPFWAGRDRFQGRSTRATWVAMESARYCAI